MSRGHCILSHGFESGPDATKVTALADAAERLGWTTERPDYTDLDARREISPVGMTETRRSTWVVAGPAKHTMPISKPSAWRSPPRHQAHAGTAMQPTSSAVQTMAVARAEAASDRNGSAAVTATPAPAKAQGHQRARGARVPNAVATLTKISMVTSASVGTAKADRSFHAAWRGHSSSR